QSFDLSSLSLYDRLGGRLLQESCGAQQKLVESDPFHACLQAYRNLADSEIKQRLGRLGVRRFAPYPCPAFLFRPLRGHVTPRAQREDRLACFVERVRELHIQSVRLRHTLRCSYLHMNPATVGHTALNLNREGHMRVV